MSKPVRIALADANLGFCVVGKPGSGKTYWMQRTLLPSLVAAHRETCEPTGFWTLDAKGSEWPGWLRGLSGMATAIIDPTLRGAEGGRVPFGLLAEGGEALASALWPSSVILSAGNGAYYLEKAAQLVRMAVDAALLGGPVSLKNVADALYAQDLHPLVTVAAKAGRHDLEGELQLFQRSGSKEYQAIMAGVQNRFGLLASLGCYDAIGGTSAGGCVRQPVGQVFVAPLTLGQAHPLILRIALMQLTTAIRQAHQQASHRVYLVLDEAPTVAGGGTGSGAGSMLRELISVGRSAGCAIVLGGQTYDALDLLELLDLADVLGTHIVFPMGQSEAGLERAVRMAGASYRVVQDPTVAGTQQTGAVYAEAIPRFSPLELACWPARQALARVHCNGQIFRQALPLEAVDLTNDVSTTDQDASDQPWWFWLSRTFGGPV